MNPNELADYLDENVEAMYACEQVHIDEAAAMLRKLQSDIELLEAKRMVAYSIGYVDALEAVKQ